MEKLEELNNSHLLKALKSMSGATYFCPNCCKMFNVKKGENKKEVHICPSCKTNFYLDME